MLWFQQKRLFGEFQRCLGITRLQLLLHDAAHADKTGFFVF